MVAISAIAAKTKVIPHYVAIARDKRSEDVRVVSFVVVEDGNVFQTPNIPIYSNGHCPVLINEGQPEQNETPN